MGRLGDKTVTGDPRRPHSRTSHHGKLMTSPTSFLQMPAKQLIDKPSEGRRCRHGGEFVPVCAPRHVQCARETTRYGSSFAKMRHCKPADDCRCAIGTNICRLELARLIFASLLRRRSTLLKSQRCHRALAGTIPYRMSVGSRSICQPGSVISWRRIMRGLGPRNSSCQR